MAAVRRATGALPNLEPRRALVHPLLVSPLMIPREHSHTGLTIHCFCARVPDLGLRPLIPTPPAVHRNLPGRPSTRLRHPRRAYHPWPRLMRRSTASSAPRKLRCAPPAPSFALRTPFQRSWPAEWPPARAHREVHAPFSASPLPGSHPHPAAPHGATHTLPFDPQPSEPLHRLSPPATPLLHSCRRSAAPTCLEAPILGAVDACAPSRAQNGAPRPVSTPLHRIRALRARCFCELQPPARASAQGAPLEGLGSNPGVARRYLPAPDR